MAGRFSSVYKLKNHLHIPQKPPQNQKNKKEIKMSKAQIDHDSKKKLDIARIFLLSFGFLSNESCKTIRLLDSKNQQFLNFIKILDSVPTRRNVKIGVVYVNKSQFN